MERRRLLSALGSATALGLAGCLASAPGSNGTPEPSSVVRGPRGEVTLPVPDSQINDVLPKNAIPAITDPVFGEDWSDINHSLEADERVIGILRDGEARAYPLAVLNYHEIVNDDFDGPLLVTFCPLCGTGVTAVRTVRGEETTFGVSGKLFRSDLVMFDELTGSLWSQILATAIQGDATGDELTLVPSTITTWEQWRTENPETQVLLPPPKSGTIVNSAPRNYDRNPYPGYDSSDQIGVQYDAEFEDDRLHPKARVIGVATEDAATAYPFERVNEVGVVNDRVGDLPVVVAAGAGETLSAFDRRVEGRVLEFDPGDETTMRAGGSTWSRTTGLAEDGPLEGTRLDDASGVSTEFWFAWLNFHPDTTVYGEEE